MDIMQNRYCEFGKKIMDKYCDYGLYDSSITLLFPKEWQEEPEETGQHLSVTNIYQIANYLKEENHLYQRNITFITNLLEKTVQKDVLPTVERQIERVVKEQLPQAQQTVVEQITNQIQQVLRKEEHVDVTGKRHQITNTTENRHQVTNVTENRHKAVNLTQNQTTSLMQTENLTSVLQQFFEQKTEIKNISPEQRTKLIRNLVNVTESNVYNRENKSYQNQYYNSNRYNNFYNNINHNINISQNYDNRINYNHNNRYDYRQSDSKGKLLNLPSVKAENQMEHRIEYDTNSVPLSYNQEDIPKEERFGESIEKNTIPEETKVYVQQLIRETKTEKPQYSVQQIFSSVMERIEKEVSRQEKFFTNREYIPEYSAMLMYLEGERKKQSKQQSKQQSKTQRQLQRQRRKQSDRISLQPDQPTKQELLIANQPMETNQPELPRPAVPEVISPVSLVHQPSTEGNTAAAEAESRAPRQEDSVKSQEQPQITDRSLSKNQSVAINPPLTTNQPLEKNRLQQSGEVEEAFISPASLVHQPSTVGITAAHEAESRAPRHEDSVKSQEQLQRRDRSLSKNQSVAINPPVASNPPVPGNPLAERNRSVAGNPPMTTNQPLEKSRLQQRGEVEEASVSPVPLVHQPSDMGSTTSDEAEGRAPRHEDSGKTQEQLQRTDQSLRRDQPAATNPPMTANPLAERNQSVATNPPMTANHPLEKSRLQQRGEVEEASVSPVPLVHQPSVGSMAVDEVESRAPGHESSGKMQVPASVTNQSPVTNQPMDEKQFMTANSAIGMNRQKAVEVSKAGEAGKVGEAGEVSYMSPVPLVHQPSAGAIPDIRQPRATSQPLVGNLPMRPPVRLTIHMPQSQGIKTLTLQQLAAPSQETSFLKGEAINLVYGAREDITSQEERQEQTRLLQVKEEVQKDISYIRETRRVVEQVNETYEKWINLQKEEKQKGNVVSGEQKMLIQKEVDRVFEKQMDASVNQIAGRVYRRLEERLKSERGRRGLM